MSEQLLLWVLLGVQVFTLAAIIWLLPKPSQDNAPSGKWVQDYEGDWYLDTGDEVDYGDDDDDWENDWLDEDSDFADDWRNDEWYKDWNTDWYEDLDYDTDPETGLDTYTYPTLPIKDLLILMRDRLNRLQRKY